MSSIAWHEALRYRVHAAGVEPTSRFGAAGANTVDMRAEHEHDDSGAVESR